MNTRDAEFTEFVRARGASLLRVAYLLTGGSQDAQDLLQTALADMYVAWPRITSKHALDSYARTAMTRRLVSWRRRRSHGAEVLTAEPEHRVDPAPTDDVDTRQTVLRALGGLTPQQRAAVVLRYYADFADQDVADALRCSVGTARSHISRGIQRLRQQLAQDGLGATARTERHP